MSPAPRSPTTREVNDARQTAVDFARRLKKAGHVAYFAGGCVRDKLLGKEPKDYDIATSATPAQVTKLFPGSNEVGAHFGVVIAKQHGTAVEIATFRTDGSYKDGRRPEAVTFSTPEEDAQRRDFTINGLFEDPESGAVIDFVGGQADLAAGVLRAIGNPADRFAEESHGFEHQPAATRFLRQERAADQNAIELLADQMRIPPLCGQVLMQVG